MRKPAWKVIVDDVAGQIASGAIPAGQKLEPEAEMALRLRVSRHTAHRAIHELQRMGLVARQRRWGTVVLERSTERKHRIGYLADFTSNLFQTHLLTNIEGSLQGTDRLLIATSRNDSELEAEHIRALVTEVDGLIVYPAEGDANATLFQEIHASGFPMVLIDRAPRGCEEMVVLTDNVEASKSAIRGLVEAGHKHIAFFGTNNDRAQSIRERHDGYVSAVPSHDVKLERWIHMNLDDNPASMYQAVADALIAMRGRDPKPTAAFCTQDWLARAVILACNEDKLMVGQDFAIATYNDFGDSFFPFAQRLVRIEQQVDEISRIAMARLYARISGQAVEPGPIRVQARVTPG